MDAVRVALGIGCRQGVGCGVASNAELVNQAQLVPARTILQATRLEDSTMWERYASQLGCTTSFEALQDSGQASSCIQHATQVQFKAALRSRIDERSGDPLRLTLVESLCPKLPGLEPSCVEINVS